MGSMSTTSLTVCHQPSDTSSDCVINLVTHHLTVCQPSDTSSDSVINLVTHHLTVCHQPSDTSSDGVSST